MAERKIQHHANIEEGIWCYWDHGKINPCQCGSNCFHYEYDGEQIFGVCNGCGRDIYQVLDEYRDEKLKQGNWVSLNKKEEL